MNRHADAVWGAVEARDEHSTHVASWRRCVNLHGLDPDAARAPPRVDAARLRAARDRAGPMLSAAGPELDRLFAAFGGVGACVLLTDEGGLALDRRGVAGDDSEFKAMGLWLGTLWDEASVGTNGIGTALVEKRAVGVHRDKHFLARNASLSCATAPIRNAWGGVAGALDISSARIDMNEALLGVCLYAAREGARRIEERLFRHAFAAARIVLAPGDCPGGLIALDRDDIVVGANAAARRAFGVDDAWIAAGRPISALLGEDAAGADGFDAAERRALRAALARADGNVAAAARALGVGRATLYRKMKRLGVR